MQPRTAVVVMVQGTGCRSILASILAVTVELVPGWVPCAGYARMEYLCMPWYM